MRAAVLRAVPQGQRPDNASKYIINKRNEKKSRKSPQNVLKAKTSPKRTENVTAAPRKRTESDNNQKRYRNTLNTLRQRPETYRKTYKVPKTVCAATKPEISRKRAQPDNVKNTQRESPEPVPKNLGETYRKRPGPEKVNTNVKITSRNRTHKRSDDVRTTYGTRQRLDSFLKSTKPRVRTQIDIFPNKNRKTKHPENVPINVPTTAAPPHTTSRRVGPCSPKQKRICARPAIKTSYRGKPLGLNKIYRPAPRRDKKKNGTTECRTGCVRAPYTPLAQPDARPQVSTGMCA